LGGLSIQAQRRVEELREVLRQGLLRLAPQADVALREEPAGAATRVALELRNVDAAQESSVREEVATALAEHIVANIGPDMMVRILRRNYGYFDQEERAQILDYARTEPPRPGIVRAVSRRLAEYLEQHSALNLDGFVTFRLKDYIADLERSLDAAVDEFMLDREYREFVRLLRYFVDVQAPKLGTVHVLLQASGRFELLDEQLQPLTGEFAADFRFETEDAEINLDDLLVSSLITAAPAQVVIHGAQEALDQPSVRTVRQVFGERLRTCTGCAACDGSQRTNV
jgi:putative sporulation protein YtxC